MLFNYEGYFLQAYNSNESENERSRFVTRGCSTMQCNLKMFALARRVCANHGRKLRIRIGNEKQKKEKRKNEAKMRGNLNRIIYFLFKKMVIRACSIYDNITKKKIKKSNRCYDFPRINHRPKYTRFHA